MWLAAVAFLLTGRKILLQSRYVLFAMDNSTNFLKEKTFVNYFEI